MTTNRSDIKGWLLRGKAKGATHVIVVCDTFDYSDYPVFISPDESVFEKYSKFQGKNMQRVMEVYDLSLDLDKQLGEVRAWHPSRGELSAFVAAKQPPCKSP